jgi:hypothetical protein
MNNRHVYIDNYYSFSTPSSKYRASAVEGFFDVFHEIFPKYKKENQYKVTATTALSTLNFSSRILNYLKHRSYFLSDYCAPRP